MAAATTYRFPLPPPTVFARLISERMTSAVPASRALPLLFIHLYLKKRENKKRGVDLVKLHLTLHTSSVWWSM